MTDTLDGYPDVVTRPTVVVVGRTAFDPEAMRRFVGDRPKAADIPPTPAGLVEACGRLCYDAFDKGRPHPEHVANLIEQGHLSVLEHAQWTLFVRGVSRTLLAELTRHRHASYCLAGDTRVYLDRPNRGNGQPTGRHGQSQYRTLRQLWEMWQDRRRTYVKTATIRTANDAGVVVHDHIREVFQSGVKPLFRLTTACGYSARASTDHLFWRPDGGFTRMGDLTPGDEVMANGKHLLHDVGWVRGRVAAGLTTPEMARLTDSAPCTVRKWRRLHRCPADLGSGTVGKTPWNAGMSYTFADPSRIRAANAENAARRRGENSELWTGGPLTWEGGHSAANAIYAEVKPCECQFCGQSAERIEIHHADGNPQNNLPDNIAFLCPPCHRAKHTGTPPLKVFPSRVVSIVPAGEEMTYDLEMAGPFKRFVADGLVVHNSVRSQRYCDESACRFVLPSDLADADLMSWLIPCRQAAVAYRRHLAYAGAGGLGRKQAHGLARSVLPGCTETTLALTMNARTARELLPKRLGAGAEPEIVRFAGVVRDVLTAECPLLFKGLSDAR